MNTKKLEEQIKHLSEMEKMLRNLEEELHKLRDRTMIRRDSLERAVQALQADTSDLERETHDIATRAIAMLSTVGLTAAVEPTVSLQMSKTTKFEKPSGKEKKHGKLSIPLQTMQLLVTATSINPLPRTIEEAFEARYGEDWRQKIITAPPARAGETYETDLKRGDSSLFRALLETTVQRLEMMYWQTDRVEFTPQTLNFYERLDYENRRSHVLAILEGWGVTLPEADYSVLTKV